MVFSTAVARPLQLVTRTLQWISAVIVMGLTSYFIHHGPHNQNMIYQEVIVCSVHFVSQPENLTNKAVLSVVFFLPAFISPFLPSALSRFVLGIDVVFSYLYVDIQ